MSVISRAVHGLRTNAITVAYRTENGIRNRLASVVTRCGWTPALLPYSGYANGQQARVLGRVVLAPPSVDPAALRGVPAWRRLLTLESPGVEVQVEFAGTTTTARSDEAGILDARLLLDAVPTAGPATALLRLPGRAPSEVTIHVSDPAAARGVVCDIDDTIWITGIAHPLKAARRMLFSTSSTRRSVPGMAALLSAAVHGQDHPVVIYLSNGPWNLAGFVSRFLHKGRFPAGTVLMTDWGITPRRWFRDGKKHKSSALARLHDDFPDIAWVLIGDDGEHDPAIYGDFAREHPDHVAAIALRQVDRNNPGHHEPARTTTRVGVPVLRGADGHDLLTPLREALDAVPE